MTASDRWQYFLSLNVEYKLRTRTKVIIKIDLSIKHFNDLLANIETKTNPGDVNLGRGFQFAKHSKQSISVFLFDTNTRVSYTNLEFLLIRIVTCFERYRTFKGKLEGILEQIQSDLLDSLLVNKKRGWEVILYFVVNSDAFLRRADIEHLEELFEGLVDVAPL